MFFLLILYMLTTFGFNLAIVLCGLVVHQCLENYYLGYTCAHKGLGCVWYCFLKGDFYICFTEGKFSFCRDVFIIENTFGILKKN